MINNISGINLFFLLLIVTSFACGGKRSPEESSQNMMKLDAPLRMKLAEMERTDDRSSIQCFISFDGSLDGERRTELEKTGVTIMSVTNNIAVVEGDPDSILHCAGLEFVQSISLSMTRHPLN